jgi:hypothetical protein
MKWQRTLLVNCTKWAENGRSTTEENRVLLWESTDNTFSVIIILCYLTECLFLYKIIHIEISRSFKFKNVPNLNLKSAITAALLRKKEPHVIKRPIRKQCGSLLRKARPPGSAQQILTALCLSCISKHHNSLGFLPHQYAVKCLSN